MSILLVLQFLQCVCLAGHEQSRHGREMVFTIIMSCTFRTSPIAFLQTRSLCLRPCGNFCCQRAMMLALYQYLSRFSGIHTLLPSTSNTSDIGCYLVVSFGA